MSVSVAASAADDPFLWLEEIRGSQSLDWVKARNQSALERLQSDARYSQFEPEFRAILTAKDRVSYVIRHGDSY